jgi:hypothetical protein
VRRACGIVELGVFEGGVLDAAMIRWVPWKLPAIDGWLSSGALPPSEGKCEFLFQAYPVNIGT